MFFSNREENAAYSSGFILNAKVTCPQASLKQEYEWSVYAKTVAGQSSLILVCSIFFSHIESRDDSLLVHSFDDGTLTCTVASKISY